MILTVSIHTYLLTIDSPAVAEGAINLKTGTEHIFLSQCFHILLYFVTLSGKFSTFSSGLIFQHHWYFSWKKLLTVVCFIHCRIELELELLLPPWTLVSWTIHVPLDIVYWAFFRIVLYWPLYEIEFNYLIYNTPWVCLIL